MTYLQNYMSGFSAYMFDFDKILAMSHDQARIQDFAQGGTAERGPEVRGPRGQEGAVTVPRRKFVDFFGKSPATKHLVDLFWGYHRRKLMLTFFMGRVAGNVLLQPERPSG